MICSLISRNLLHRLSDTPGSVEPGWVCQCIGASAQPVSDRNHLLSLHHTTCCSQLLVVFLGLAADVVLHLIESAHRAVQCLEEVGVSSVPCGVPVLHLG